MKAGQWLRTSNLGLNRNNKPLAFAVQGGEEAPDRVLQLNLSSRSGLTVLGTFSD